jgi:hypothetical protein
VGVGGRRVSWERERNLTTFQTWKERISAFELEERFKAL